jgi:hypothetical protein
LTLRRQMTQLRSAADATSAKLRPYAAVPAAAKRCLGLAKK